MEAGWCKEMLCTASWDERKKGVRECSCSDGIVIGADSGCSSGAEMPMQRSDSMGRE